ncbi:MAG: hypothetical protein KDB23_07715, partial [Planctomycetales bacterium]|nr:hypothetical protein [Planctomycetales bacterium]
YVKNSDLTIGGSTFSVTATNDNPDSDGRIFSIAAGVGATTGPDSSAGVGAMLSVNLTTNITEAYVLSSDITDDQTTAYVLSATVSANDDSGILAIVGGVGFSTGGTSIGAAIGYNEIDNDVRAYLDDTSVTIDGGLAVTATSDGEIGGVAVGVAVTTTSSGKLAGAGSLIINQITNTIDAHIADTVGDDDAAISTRGDVTLTADDDSLIVSLSGGVAIAFRGTAVGASVSYNLISNQIDSYIEDVTVDAHGTDADLTLFSNSNSTLVSVALGVAGSGGNAAIGGSLTVNSIANSVDSHIKNSSSIEATGDISVQAITSDTLVAVAGGFSASLRGSAVGASIAYNFIGGSFDAANPDVVNRDSDATDQITAYIENAAVSAGGDLIVTSGYREAAMSAPLSIDIWSEADEDNVTLPEEVNSQIVSIAVAGGAADNVAVSGSVSLNFIAHDINASITGERTVQADGTIVVIGSDDTKVTSVAGSLALGQNGVGISGSVLVDRSHVDAFVGANANVQARGNGSGIWVANGTKNDSGQLNLVLVKGLAVTATSFENYDNVAIGLAGGARFGVAGSAGVLVVDRSTLAHIDAGAEVNTDTTNESTAQSVFLLASDRSESLGIGGSAAFGGKGGIGIGADIGYMKKDTQAWISHNSTVHAESDVRVLSNSQERVISGAAGIAVGLTAGVAGAVDVYVVNITTKAFIEGGLDGIEPLQGATVHAGGSVQVAAEAANEMDMFSGNVAGGSSAAVGGAITVPVVTKDTYAYIGDDAVVDALGNRTGLEIATGKFDISFVTYGDQADGQVSPVDIETSDVGVDESDSSQPNPLLDQQLTGQRVATPIKVAGFKGVAVTATNQDDVASYALGASISPTAAVQVSANVNLITANTHAFIGKNTEINKSDVNEGADQSVFVGAGNDYQHLGVAGGAALSGTVGVTPGVDLSVVSTTTRAYIDEAAVVEATGDVTVQAQSRDDIMAIAIAIGGGGTVGVGGSVAVLAIDNDTQAYIADDAMVSTDGNLLLYAGDHTDADVISSALGIGISAAGVGAGIGVTVIDKNTQAWIGNATVDALGNSAVSMTVFDGTLDDAGVFGTTDNTDDVRGVAVIAETSEDALSVAVAGGAGTGAGIAGAVTVAIINSDTQAYIVSGAEVNKTLTGANDHQDVHVSAINDVTTFAVSGAIGLGTAGLAGGVDVGMVRNDTTAYIAGDVHAERDVRVNALSDREIQSYTISAGGGAAGLGAAATIYTIGGDLVQSYSYDGESSNSLEGSDGDILDMLTDFIQSGDVNEILDAFEAPEDFTTESTNQAVTSGNKVLIADSYADVDRRGKLYEYVGSADLTVSDWSTVDFDDATQWLIVDDYGISSVSDAAGSSVTDAYADDSLEVTNAKSSQLKQGTSAFIANDATVVAGRHIDLDARNRIELIMLGGGLGIGGAGIGAGIAILNVDSDVSAYIGGDATITAASADDLTGDVTIDADIQANYGLLGITGGFGLFAGVAGSLVMVTDNSDAEAYITDSFGEGTKITSADEIRIHANNTTDVELSAVAAALGIGGAAGVGLVFIDLSQTTDAHIGDNTVIGAGVGAPPTVGVVEVLATSTTEVTEFHDSDFMTAAISVGTGAVAAGYVDVSIQRTTEATVGANVEINASSQLTVEATSNNFARLIVDGLAVGLVGVGAMIGSSEIDSTTHATIESGTVNAGALSVLATDTSVTSVEISPAGGGIVSGNGADADASVTTDVSASLGNVQATITDDVEVLATSAAEADATADGLSVGGLTVGVSLVDIVVEPTVESYIGAGSVIVAGGNVTVQANSGDAAVPIDDQIDPTDVDVTNDTITVPSHGMRNGDTVTYADTDGDNVAGQPTDGREYHVIVVDDDTIQLGETFNASSGVNSNTDTIVFAAAHLLQEGDTVIYSYPAGEVTIGGLTNGSSYLVHVIDDYTIKLLDPSVTLAAAKEFAASGAVNSTSDTITINGHSFVSGQAVTYHAPAHQTFTSVAVDVSVVADAVVVDAAESYVDFPANDNIYLPAHGFQTGDEVHYDKSGAGQAIEGLTAGANYFVIRRGDNELQLAERGADFNGNSDVDVADSRVAVSDEFATGDVVIYQNGGGTDIGGLTNHGVYFVGNVTSEGIQLFATLEDATFGDRPIAFTSAGAGANQRFDKQIELTPSKSGQDRRTVHSLVAAADAPIGGLVDGYTYFVDFTDIAPGQTANNFHLVDKDGTRVDLDATGLSTTALHSLGTESIHLTGTTSRTHSLRFDITAVPVGTDQLLGRGGLLLSQTNATSGDNISTGTVTGSSGALIAIDAHHVTIEITPNVSAYIAAASVTTGDEISERIGNVSVEANTTVSTSADGNNGSGGAVAVGVVNAEVTITNTNSAAIGDGTVISSFGDVTVLAQLFDDMDSNVDVNGGGLANASESNSEVTIDFSNTTAVGNGASITASGDVTISADTALEGLSRGDADAGGAGAGANALGLLEVPDTSETLVTVGSARILSENATVSAVVSSLDLRAVGTAEVNAGLGFTDADATLNIADSAEVILESGAWVEGTSVSLLAEHRDVDATTYAVGDSNSLGEADATSTTDYQADSTISVMNGATVAGNVVNVDANQTFLRYERHATAEAVGDKDEENLGELNAIRAIDYSGDIVLLVRPDAYLEISPDGIVTSAEGITVNNGKTVNANVAGSAISVDNITNEDDAGHATIATSNSITLDSNTSPDATISGSNGNVRVKTTYDAITIINNSNEVLVLNDVNRASQGVQGSVVLSSDNVTATFHISDSIGPTDILVENPNSNLTIAGLIDNPLGSTTILNANGTINDDQDAGSVIRSNQLTMDAQSVGSAANRLQVDLVRSIGYETDLSIDSAQDIYLDLRGRLRDPDATLNDFATSTLSAGGEVDIRIASTLQELVGLTTPGTPFDGSGAAVDGTNDTLTIADTLQDGAAVVYRNGGGTNIGDLLDEHTYYVRNTATAGVIQLFETKEEALDSASATPVDLSAGTGTAHRLDIRITVAGIRFTYPLTNGDSTGTYYNEFRPDQGAADPLNAVVYTDTSLAHPIDGAFTFGHLIAGNNAVVKAADATATAPRIDITADTDVLNSGYLDFVSNGSIAITETFGDARIRLIQSNVGDAAIEALFGAVYDIRDAAEDDGLHAWVIGNNVSIRASGGEAIAALDDFLEIDSSYSSPGEVFALAGTSVYLKEIAGDLNLDGIVAQDGNVILITLSGSLTDFDDAEDTRANIQGTDIDLLISGSIGTATNPVDIYGAGVGQSNVDNAFELDPSVPHVGRLYVDAENDIYLQEMFAALN